MWILQLNPMTGQAENVVPIVRAESREALEAFVNAETVEPYQDGRFHKVFRQGGTLEWFNPPFGDQAFINVPAFVDIGTEEDWAARARERFQQIQFDIPSV
jgi:hypothetical protein